MSLKFEVWLLLFLLQIAKYQIILLLSTKLQLTHVCWLRASTLLACCLILSSRWPSWSFFCCRISAGLDSAPQSNVLTSPAHLNASALAIFFSSSTYSSIVLPSTSTWYRVSLHGRWWDCRQTGKHAVSRQRNNNKLGLAEKRFSHHAPMQHNPVANVAN